LVKHLEGRFESLNTIKDLLGHPVEGWIFFFLVVILDDDIPLGPRILTSLKESAEAILQYLGPQEFESLLRTDVVLGGINHLLEVVFEGLDRTEQHELVFDLDEEITSRIEASVQSRNESSDRDEVIDNLLEDVADTVLALIALDRRIKLDLPVSQVQLDVEHWRITLELVHLDTDLVSQELHGGVDTPSDAFDDQRVQVVDIG
jgi:hypothetical protein